MPFLLACEDLQSRLYNILCLGGLGPLRARDGYPYAEETLYLVARYFAYEPLLVRHTPYGTDNTVVQLLDHVRGCFSSDAGGIDGWCLFRARQHALGRLALETRQREDQAIPDAVSLLEFERRLVEGDTADALYMTEGLNDLSRAASVNDLPPRTRQRLAEIQRALVDVLEHFEGELANLGQSEDFSLFGGEKRKRAPSRP